MFLENAFIGKTELLRYIGGTFIVIIAYFIASVPFGVAIVMELGSENVAGISENEMLSILDPNTTLFYILLPFAAAFFMLLLVVRYIHNLPIKFLVTSRNSFDWKRVFFSFGLIAVLVMISVLVDQFISPEDYVWNYDPNKFWGLVLIAVIMIPLQTTAEELLMRGYLFQGIGVVFKNRLAPLLITSISFGLLHAFNPEVEKLGNGLILAYIITGLFLGMITLLDEGLELSIGFHAANNLFIALLVTADWTAFQTNSIDKDVSDPVLVEFIVMPLILYGLVLFIFSKKYKWHSWTSKLTGPVKKE
ncbi:MAG: CPBP family intramembrane glutamic endopeptidase [Bacteroidota bacterium]|nr:CPBP family intramembrane glutamic endopeptidase [Bacteroidota bacterium]